MSVYLNPTHEDVLVQLDDKDNVGPDINMVKTVHRQQDGYVTFHTKKNGNFKNLFAISMNELDSMFPSIIEHLIQDSYMSVNTYYAAGQCSSTVDKRLPYPIRGEKYLRYLNACYVDLDVGRPDDKDINKQVTWTSAVSAVLFCQDIGALPPASIIARSGRGAYLLWLLKDKNGNGQFAYPSDIQLYREINKTMTKQLANFGADLNAFDAARILRVSGSIHTGAKQQVKYLIQADSNGYGYQYTMQELADFFKVDTQKNKAIDNYYEKQLPLLKKAHKPGSAPKRKKGGIKTAKNRVEDILKIELYRNGFDEGKRRKSIEYLAEFMRIAGIHEEEALTTAFIIAKNCNNSDGSKKLPFPSHKNDQSVKALVQSIYERKSCMPRIFKNCHLASFFGVDAKLAKELKLLSIVPQEVTKERSKTIAPRTIKKKRILLFMHKLLRQKPGAVPSIKTFKNYLFNNYGLKCSRQTISNYLKEFEKTGEISRRTPASSGRPRKTNNCNELENLL